MLVFTNTACSQLHFIHPDFDGAQPTLRRMVVERDLPRRTAVEQFSKVYWSYERSGSIRDALAEGVRRRTRHQAVLPGIQASIRGREGASVRIRPQREASGYSYRRCSTRLMFVYFLSRKGWLTFSGDKDYLNALWNDYRAAPLHSNFYTSRLRPSSSPDSTTRNRGTSTATTPRCMTASATYPFLNGGLFEKTALDERDGVVVLPDGAVEPVLRDLFDKFNFTVMESTPFDIEVAVDPEMLGKVFEELVTGRHESGSYYTPRPVVSFMCREALKGYLEGRDIGLSCEAVAAVRGRAQGLPRTSRSHRRWPCGRQRLEQITVVDPACGSGAYLLGMMQELIELANRRSSTSGVDARGSPRPQVGDHPAQPLRRRQPTSSPST